MIGAIILAAGASRRFGGDKRLARLGSGRTVLARTVELALGAFDAALLTLRHDDEGLGRDMVAAFDDARLACFQAPDSALGMGHSLANAIAKARDWEGAFIFLGDMPFVQPQTLATLKTAFADAAGAPIVLPTYAGKPGHPVGFHCRYFGELARLAGDKGAKSILDAHRPAILEVEVDDLGVLQDVDRPEDLVAE